MTAFAGPEKMKLGQAGKKDHGKGSEQENRTETTENATQRELARNGEAANQHL